MDGHGEFNHSDGRRLRKNLLSDTTDNTKMIGNKVLEFSNGLMVVNTKETGH